MPMIKKQKTILDFFKKIENNSINDNNSKSSLCQSSIEINDGINEKSAVKEKIVVNHKRPLDDENEDDKTVNGHGIPNNDSQESIIEINYIDENLCQFSFHEIDNNNTLPEIDLNDSETANNASIDDNSEIDSKNIFQKFRHVIQSVLQNPLFENLFNEDDWKQIQLLTSLDGLIQVLYVRLYMRKHDWIRVVNIKYPQLFDSNENNHSKQLETLLNHDLLLDHRNIQSIEEGFNALTMLEMKLFLKKYNGFKLPKSNQKCKIIESFLAYIRSTRSVCMNSNGTIKTIEEQVLLRLRNYCQFKFIRLNEIKSEILDRIFLLYYSPNDLLDNIENNNEDYWHRRILSSYDDDYGLVSDEINEQIYADRQELIEFVQAFNLLCKLIVWNSQKRYQEIIDQLFPIVLERYNSSMIKWSYKDKQLSEYLRPFTATGMYLRCMNQCLQSLDKNRLYNIYVTNIEQLLEQNIYGIKYRPHWYTRSSLICQNHLKSLEKTVEMCLKGLNDPAVCNDHSLKLYKRLISLKMGDHKNDSIKSIKEKINNQELIINQSKQNFKKRTIVASYCNIENESSRKNFFISKNSENNDIEMISVEEVVRRHYLNEDFTNGLHCESSVYHSLFELLLADVIFSTKISNVYRYYGQKYPLDLSYQSFYQQRKSMIVEKIYQISNWPNESLESNIIELCQQKLYPIDYDFIITNNLHEIAYCMTSEKLAKILHIMARDYRHFRKGFPDLIMWNREKGRFKAIEVKGPGDRISDIQSIWLQQMTEIDLDCELCMVKQKDVKINEI